MNLTEGKKAEIDGCFRKMLSRHYETDSNGRRTARKELNQYPNNVFGRAWTYYEMRMIKGI